MRLSSQFWSTLISPLFFFSVLICTVSAFNFSLSTPIACAPLTVSWLAGKPPFYLLIIPAFGVPSNISIPADHATTNGSFTLPLNLQPNTRFLVAMSDATGFASGGVSQIFVAQPSDNQTITCHTQVDPDFTFQADLSLKQCSSFVFAGYKGAVLPLRFIGFIPKGDIIPLQTSNPSQLSWPVNVATGTDLVFIAVDADNRSGGATDLLTVIASNNNSCLNSHSPSSTAVLVPSITPAGASADVSIKSPHGAIIGGAVGGALFGALLFAVLLYLYWRHRKSRRKDHTARVARSLTLPGRRDTQPRMRARNNIHLIPDDQPFTPMQMSATADLEPNPFVLPYSPTNSIHSSSPDHEHNLASPTTRTSHTRRDSKAGMSTRTSVHTPRLVLHTDVESEDEQMSQIAEVVELPPQYKSTRKSLLLTGQPSNPSPD